MDRRALARAVTRVGGVLALVGLAGCKSLGLDGQPDDLVVDIEAIGVSEVSLVTSTSFTFLSDANCEEGQQCDQSLLVLAADTVTQAVPFHHTYAFTSSRKYLVEVFPTNGETATLSMRVQIDGREWFNEARELQPTGEDGAQETLLFTYAFSIPGSGS